MPDSRDSFISLQSVDLLQLMMGMCFTVESVPNKEGSSESCAIKDAQCKLVVLTERPDPESCIGCHRATRAPELSSLCARLRSTLGLSALSFMHVALM